MSTSSVLRAGVIGAGSGGSLSIAALAGSARFDLVAVADVDPAAIGRVTRNHPGVASYGSAEDMVAAGELDVVCVSTYAPTHLPLAAAALAHGVRGLLVEKPLCPTTAEARTLLDLAAVKVVPIVVPHGLMAMSAPLQIIDRIRAGAIGDLHLVEIECTGWDIVNAGIHWLQYFLAITEGDPARTVLTAADTSTRTFRDGMQVETEAVTLVRTTAGVRLVMNTGDDIPIARPGAGCLMRFIGATGVLEYVAWEQSYCLTTEGRPAETVEVEPFGVSGHQRHLEHLADLVAAGRTDDRIPELSLRALEIVEAAYLSHRWRAAVTLPLTVPAAGQDAQTPPVWSPGDPYTGVGGGRNGRQL